MSLWYAPDGLANSATLAATHAEVFEAVAELDRLSHLILEGALGSYEGLPWETTLGFSLIRRSIVQFEGVRYLCERSSIQSASLVARAHFETLLAARYLVYGTKRFVSNRTKTTPRGREVRARYYRVEELRREVYRRQAALDRRLSSRSLPKGVRTAVQGEISERVDFLDRHFPVQQKRFGSFRCFPPTNPVRHHDPHPWYAYGFSLKNRPKVRTIRGLAAAFGWVRDYEVLYDAFSGFAHVRGLHHDTEVEPGSVAVRVPHTPDDFETIVFFAWHWQLYLMNILAKCYHPTSLVEIQAFDHHYGPLVKRLHGSVLLGTT